MRIYFSQLGPLDVVGAGGMRKVCQAGDWLRDGHLLGDDGGPRWSVGGCQSVEKK